MGFAHVLVFDRQPTSLAEIEFFPWFTGDTDKDSIAGRPAMSVRSVVAARLR